MTGNWIFSIFLVLIIANEIIEGHDDTNLNGHYTFKKLYDRMKVTSKTSNGHSLISKTDLKRLFDDLGFKECAANYSSETCNLCFTPEDFLQWNGYSADTILTEEQFEKSVASLLYMLTTPDDFKSNVNTCRSIINGTIYQGNNAFQRLQSKYGSNLTEESVGMMLTDVNGTIGMNLTGNECFSIEDVIKGANVSRNNITEHDFEFVTGFILLKLANKNCIKNSTLPAASFFIDDIFTAFTSDKNTMTHAEFAAFYKTLKLGKEFLNGSTVTNTHGHSHRRRRRGAGHEDDPAILKYLRCYSAQEILQIYNVPAGTTLDKAKFKKIGPALAQQLEHGSCLPTATQHNSTDLPPSNFFIDDLFGAFTSINNMTMTHADFAKFYKVLKLGSEFMSTTTSTDSHGHSHRRRRGAGHEDDPAILKYLRCYSANEILQIYDVREGTSFGKTVFEEMIPSLVQQVEHGSCKPPLPASNFFIDDIFTAFTSAKTGMTHAEFAAFYKTLRLGKEFMTSTGTNTHGHSHRRRRGAGHKDDPAILKYLKCYSAQEILQIYNVPAGTTLDKAKFKKIGPALAQQLEHGSCLPTATQHNSTDLPPSNFFIDDLFGAFTSIDNQTMTHADFAKFYKVLKLGSEFMSTTTSTDSHGHSHRRRRGAGHKDDPSILKFLRCYSAENILKIYEAPEKFNKVMFEEMIPSLVQQVEHGSCKPPLPKSNFFIDDIFTAFTSAKTEMTHHEFAAFYKTLKLGKEFMTGTAGTNSHSHRRRRGAGHKDDPAIVKYLKCYSASEILKIYDVSVGTTIDKAKFKKIGPALVQQLEHGSCLPTAKQHNSTELPPSNFFIDDLFGAFTSAKTNMTHSEFAAFYKVVKLGAEFMSTTTSSGNHGHSHRRRRGAGHKDDPAILKFLRCYSAEDILKIYKAPEQFNKVMFEEMIPSLVQQVEHGSCKPPLPKSNFFIDDIFTAFTSAKTAMTHDEFAKFYKTLKLGKEFLKPSTGTNTHRRKRGAGHEDDPNILKYLRCYSAKEILQIYNVPVGTTLDKAKFKKIGPALAQQLEHGSCLPTATQNNSTDLPPHYFFVDDLFGAFTSAKDKMTHIEFAEFYKVLKLGTEFKSTTGGDSHGHSHRRRRGAGHEDDPAILKFLRCYSAEEILKIYDAPDMFGKTMFENIIPALLQQVEHGSCKPPLPASNFFIDDIFTAFTSAKDKMTNAEFAKFYKTLKLGKEFMTSSNGASRRRRGAGHKDDPAILKFLKCYSAEEILKIYGAEKTTLDKAKFKKIGPALVQQLEHGSCLPSATQHSSTELPPSNFFIDDLFGAFTTAKTNMTHSEFAKFYKVLKLGPEFKSGTTSTTTDDHGHSHRRRRGAGHEDDPSILKYLRCYSSEEILDIYKAPELFNKEFFEEMTASMVQQVEHGSCNPGPDLPKSTFFIDDIFGAFTSNKRAMSHEDFEKFYKVLQLGSDVVTTSGHGDHGHGDNGDHGHAHRRRRGAGHVDDPAIVKYLKCYSAKEIMTIYNVPKGTTIGKTKFQEICPSLVQQLEHGSCKPNKTGSGFTLVEEDEKWKPWIGMFISTFVLALTSLIGLLTNPVTNKHWFPYLLMGLITLAVSVLIGDAILHLLPHSLKLHSHGPGNTHHDHGPGNPLLAKDSYIWKCVLLLIGFYVFFMFEIFMHMIGKDSTHSHGSAKMYPPTDTVIYNKNGDHQGEVQINSNGKEDMEMQQRTDFKKNKLKVKDYRSVVWMVITGDALHNFLDGVAVGVAFSETWPSGLHGGISTTIAILAHELPQEIGDFAVFLNSGLSLKQAIIMNVLSQLSGFVGGIIGTAIGLEWNASEWVFAITAGLFIYIALVDMLPEVMHSPLLKKKPGLSLLIINIAMWTGFVIMFILGAYEDKIHASFS